MDLRVANTLNAYSVYNNPKNGNKKTEQKDGAAKAADVFSLSTQAADYQVVRKVLIHVPDVRAERIEKVKAQLEAGEYGVSSSDVAAKIIQGLE